MKEESWDEVPFYKKLYVLCLFQLFHKGTFGFWHPDGLKHLWKKK